MIRLRHPEVADHIVLSLSRGLEDAFESRALLLRAGIDAPEWCDVDSGEQGRARLVVLARETGGRWSEEAQDFLMQLARARARSEPREIRDVPMRALCRGTSVRDVIVGAPRRDKVPMVSCHPLLTWLGWTVVLK